MSCRYGVSKRNSGDLGVPCQGISTGRRSAAFEVSKSWSRLSGSAMAGSELKNRRFLANDSATAFAPFIRAMA